MSTYLFKYLLIIFIFCLFSCEKDECERDYNFHGDTRLVFEFHDKKTGENLLDVRVQRYFYDTIKIYNEELNRLNFTLDYSGRISLNFLTQAYYSNEPISTPLSKTYFIYFEEGDYDTLKVDYKIGFDECNYKILTEWATFYNDSLHFSHNPNTLHQHYPIFIKDTSK